MDNAKSQTPACRGPANYLFLKYFLTGTEFKEILKRAPDSVQDQIKRKHQEKRPNFFDATTVPYRRVENYLNGFHFRI